MKPIVSNFRAAARLVNEWRDTLLYSAVGAQALEAIAHGNKHAIAEFLTFMSVREALRSLSWSCHSEKRLVGDNSPSVNAWLNSTTAGIITGLGWVLQETPPIASKLSGWSIIDAVYAAFMATWFLHFGGKPQNIPHIYFDGKTGMWDWPRKSGDGGISQTQKLVNGFKDLGKKLAGLIPSPAPLPAPGYGRSLTPSIVDPH